MQFMESLVYLSLFKPKDHVMWLQHIHPWRGFLIEWAGFDAGSLLKGPPGNGWIRRRCIDSGPVQLMPGTSSLSSVISISTVLSEGPGIWPPANTLSEDLDAVNASCGSSCILRPHGTREESWTGKGDSWLSCPDSNEQTRVRGDIGGQGCTSQ